METMKGLLMSVAQDLFRTAKLEYYSRSMRAMNSIIFLTYRCTSQCTTCNIWKRNSECSLAEELKWKEWKTILEKMKAYGIQTVEIFGGDALLRKDIIYDVIRYCRDNGMETFFATNSILLDEETAGNLVKAGLGTIYFSLDNVGSGHDRIRGKTGAFTAVHNALEHIVRARNNREYPKIVIITTISNMNYNHLQEVVEFAGKYPVNTLLLRILGEFQDNNIKQSAVKGILPEPYFTTSDGTSHLLTGPEVAVLRNVIKKVKETPSSIYINSRDVEMAPDRVFTNGEHPPKKCLVCSTLITVDPLGNVNPCPMYNTYRLGNLVHQPLEHLWGNQEHSYFIKAQRRKRLPVCRNCNMRISYPTFDETCRYYGKRAIEKMRG